MFKRLLARMKPLPLLAPTRQPTGYAPHSPSRHEHCRWGWWPPSRPGVLNALRGTTLHHGTATKYRIEHGAGHARDRTPVNASALESTRTASNSALRGACGVLRSAAVFFAH